MTTLPDYGGIQGFFVPFSVTTWAFNCSIV
jgi:hypothetical protein